MKQHTGELAILGGEPTFNEKFHVGRPNLGDREQLMRRINDILDNRWFTNNGPYVQEFETEIAKLIGVKHCVAICNATVALEIVIRALGLTGEVIIPSMTFIATAHALQWQEITPVFCDIDPVTLCIDPDKVEKLITPRTTGIIGVHLFGRVCNVDALAEIAKRHNLKLMFDAAHALSCTRNGVYVGNFGDAEVFSFHATKFFNSFEGGAIVTNDDELARKLRLMKNFGFAGYDNVVYIGTNGKMIEVSAAMGLTSLESLNKVIDINCRNYHAYLDQLADLPGVTLLRYNDQEKTNYQYIVMLVDETITGISRDQLMKILHAENILARRYFYPGCHKMEPYRSYFPHAGLLLPVTEAVSLQTLSLPTGTAVSLENVQAICGIIRLAVLNGHALQKKIT